MLSSLTAALRRTPRWGAFHLGHCCALMLLATQGITALAQTPPSAAASTPIADHVKRAAERPYYWIKLNAQTPEPPAPRPKVAARPVTKTPPTTADGAASAPALPARVSGIIERVTPIIESPALATSDPAPREAVQGLIATLESAPPAAGSALPAVANPAPLTPDSGMVSPAVAPASSSGRADSTSAATAVSTSLKLLSQVEPDFPSALQRRLRQGSVEVAFTVLPDGRVSAPSVLRSSHPRLDAPALEAVAQWRFEPIAAPKGGVVEVGFKLDP